MANLPDKRIRLLHAILPDSLPQAALTAELAASLLWQLGRLCVVSADSSVYVFNVSSHLPGVNRHSPALVAQYCIVLYSGP